MSTPAIGNGQAGAKTAASQDSATRAASGPLPVHSASDLLVQLAERLEHRADLQQELAQTDREVAAQVRLAAGAVSRLMVTVNERSKPGGRLLSARQVGERIGVDAKTVQRWRSEGKMPPAFTTGSVVRWDSDAIEDWIAERTEP